MVTAVVLAAGASTRMGRPKLLLPLGGEPLVRRTVRQVIESGFDDVLVVVGFDAYSVLTALEGLRCRHAVNTKFQSGMGSSFQTAIEALDDCEAAMFALADQPFVTAREYASVLAAYRKGGAGIVSVRYGDVTAPPHLFDRRFFQELAELEHGARPVLQRHRDDTTVLQFPPEMLLDVDTPEDYQRAVERISSGR
jgi:molybdenum cofactor cytidylyltransferase